jgi:RNA polymerase sigma-70 factor (ECF subfamily)
MESLVLLRETRLMSDLSSPELIEKAQQGRAEAIGALYDSHCQAIYRYFHVRLGHQQTAEDLTGEVFRRMITGLPKYRASNLPFRAWLFRIAHNLLIDHYRQEGVRKFTSLAETETAGEAEIDPLSAVEQKLTLEDAYHALSRLEASQRDVLALRFLSGLSLKETALAMGRTEDAVKALQRRGLMALRLRLGWK